MFFLLLGLSSPHDGVLAKRRKLKQQNSGHSRSVESGMGSQSIDHTRPNLSILALTAVILTQINQSYCQYFCFPSSPNDGLWSFVVVGMFAIHHFVEYFLFLP
jgi:hypothetical protein